MNRKSIFNKPFIHITIPMAIGIVFYYYIAMSIKSIVFGLVLILSIYLIMICNNRSSKIIIYVLFFFLGLILMYGKTEKSVISCYANQNIEIDGIIKEVKESEGFTNAILKGESIVVDGIKKPIKEKILIRIYGDMKVNIGDEIKLNGTVKEPNRNTNPKLFNYKLYLETNNIFAIINTRDYKVRLISKGNLSYGEKLRIKFKTSVEETFTRYLNDENSQLMTSIMLGDMNYLDDNNQIKYRELGLAHLMAISGLHIGILSTFLIYIFYLMGINRKINLLITITIIWLYGYLIGYPPSVLRALIMFTVLFYSQLINRPYDNINVLCFAAFILLICNPLWLFNIGFQLSFMATFFLITFSKLLKNKFYPYNGKIFNSLYTIIAVQIGIIPVIAYYFNSISLVSILANLILIPLLSICVILGFIVYIVSWLSVFLANILGSILNYLLTVENVITDYIFMIPITTIRVKSPDILVITLYYISLFCMFDIIKIKEYFVASKKKYYYSIAIFMLIFSILPVFNNEVKVKFIDVGQGDSILLQSKGENFLVDTGGNLFGNFDVGKNILVPYLVKSGIFTLDGVFITHFHEDHAKSLPYLMDNIKVKHLFIGYEAEKNQIYSDIVEASKAHHIPIYKLNKGDILSIDEGISMKALNPSNEIISRYIDNENNLSLVLLLNSYNYKTLLTGDIEEEIEILLAEEGEKIDFLKTPHHGSSTSSSKVFLDAFSPEYAFIMVGNNNFGHPNKDILDRYEKSGIKVFRTDKSGLITLTITSKGYNIYEFIQEKNTLIEIISAHSMELNMLLIYSILWYIIISIDTYYYKELNTYELSGTNNAY